MKHLQAKVATGGVSDPELLPSRGWLLAHPAIHTRRTDSWLVFVLADGPSLPTSCETVRSSELLSQRARGESSDVNAAERALRGVVLGRKNHYGSRSRRGTEVAALFYSLCETAKLLGVEPRTYRLEATRVALKAPGTVTLPHKLTH